MPQAGRDAEDPRCPGCGEDGRALDKEPRPLWTGQIAYYCTVCGWRFLWPPTEVARARAPAPHA